jgi:hypothetical protein
MLVVTLLGRAGSSLFHMGFFSLCRYRAEPLPGGAYIGSNRGATGPRAPTGENLKGEPGGAVSDSVRLADSRDREC